MIYISHTNLHLLKDKSFLMGRRGKGEGIKLTLAHVMYANLCLFKVYTRSATKWAGVNSIIGIVEVVSGFLIKHRSRHSSALHIMQIR